MTVTAIADAKEDFEGWLEARKPYLTSSQMFTWRGVNIPDWWEDTRETIEGEKFGDLEKRFDHEVTVSMAHGNFDEENVMRKFGRAVGAPVEPCNKLFVNDQWPHLAASIDGFVHVPSETPDYSLFQSSTLLNEVRTDMSSAIDGDQALLCEIKKSTSTKWQTEVPIYYIPQLQTQLHILDLPAAVIVAETLKRGDDQKWRMFWDMRAYLVLRNPTWESKLDQANKEFGEMKAKYE